MIIFQSLLLFVVDCQSKGVLGKGRVRQELSLTDI
jgi:hypothetical protein